MGLLTWLDSKIKNMRWYDISLTKICVAAFILMVAKLWSPILSLEWYWYGLIFVLTAIIPIRDVFR